jgi:hypothetical protein
VSYHFRAGRDNFLVESINRFGETGSYGVTYMLGKRSLFHFQPERSSRRDNERNF